MFPKLSGIAIAAAFLCSTAHAENIRIAHIDPFSGPAAAIFDNSLKTLKSVVEIANRQKWAGGNTLEVIEFDGKGKPEESLMQLKNATDQGIRYVVQGGGSNVAVPLIDAINKYNERNPGKEVLFLDPTNTAPELTNEKCSFWHFRFDSHIEMKAEALVSYLAKDKSLKKVYQINQNFTTGQSISVAVRAALKRMRPDIEIVGDDLHPLLQVKDFSPYVAKIRAAGAEALITGNWGGDLTLLLKAAKDSSLKIPIYTFQGTTKGTPTALAAAGIEGVKNIAYWTPNDDLAGSKAVVEPFRKQYDDDFVFMPHYSLVAMFSKALKETKSTDPVKVAFAMEGMKTRSMNGEIEMRTADHQVLQPLVVTSWTRVNGKDVVYDQEKTGFGWKTVDRIAAAATAQPTTCQMTRPAR